jgi:hypothetical protein
MPGGSSPFCITKAQIRHGLVSRLGERGRGHPSRNVDLIEHVVIIVLATYSVDHRTEDHETVIAIFEAATRLKPGWAAPKQMDVIFMGVQLDTMPIKLRAEKVY